MSIALAASAAAAEPPARVTSTVRADRHTGRLIRTAIVAPLPADLKKSETAAQPQPSIDVSGIIDQAARTHEVDPLLIHSVIRVESNYNPFAVSPKGAEGMMQLIPATARRFGAVNSFDVRENITAGVKYLKYLQEMFKDDRLALAAYNAGEGAVAKYKNIPPYRETEQYVDKVGKTYGEARKRSQPAQAATAPAPSPQQPAAEPLRQLDVMIDSEGRLIFRTR